MYPGRFIPGDLSRAIYPGQVDALYLLVQGRVQMVLPTRAEEPTVGVMLRAIDEGAPSTDALAVELWPSAFSSYKRLFKAAAAL